jgi:hypothetical protein
MKSWSRRCAVILSLGLSLGSTTALSACYESAYPYDTVYSPGYYRSGYYGPAGYAYPYGYYQPRRYYGPAYRYGPAYPNYAPPAGHIVVPGGKVVPPVAYPVR